MALRNRRKAPANNVFVEPLARSDAEGEAVVRQDPEGRRRLRDDRRVVAHGRAGHAGREIDGAGGCRDGSEYRPGKGRVALLVEPGVKVVADLDKVESGVLRQLCLADQFFGAETL